MNRKQTLIVIAAAATLVSGSVLAGEIYRYTDEDGNLHYGDRPTGVDTEQRVAIASRRTDNAAVQARAAERYAQPEPEAQAQQQPEEEEETEQRLTRAERAAQARQRAEQCQTYRDRLETFVASPRLYREDESGERVYLDEAESDEARAKVQELIEENCD